jgi:hypothetical protein
MYAIIADPTPTSTAAKVGLLAGNGATMRDLDFESP